MVGGRRGRPARGRRAARAGARQRRDVGTVARALRDAAVDGPAVSRRWLHDAGVCPQQHRPAAGSERRRSEEHTSELQSLMRISYAVFCLKKKKKNNNKKHKTPA